MPAENVKAMSEITLGEAHRQIECLWDFSRGLEKKTDALAEGLHKQDITFARMENKMAGIGEKVGDIAEAVKALAHSQSSRRCNEHDIEIRHMREDFRRELERVESDKDNEIVSIVEEIKQERADREKAVEKLNNKAWGLVAGFLLLVAGVVLKAVFS